MIALILQTDDWKALYIGGTLIDEGHSLNNLQDWIKWTNIYQLEGVITKYVTDEDYDTVTEIGSFPKELKNLSGKYE